MWFLFSAVTPAAQGEESVKCILLQQQQKRKPG